MIESCLSDSVVERAAKGDLGAREQILKEFRPLLRMAAARYLQRTFAKRFDASDVVQQTCLEAHQSFDSFQGSRSQEVHLWMESILKRTVFRLLERHTADKRDARREGPHESVGPDLSIVWTSAKTESKSPISEIISGEDAIQIAKALQELPENYRIVIEKRFLDERKLREIANEEGVTIGVVAGRLRRGLQLLSQLLSVELRHCLGIGDSGLS